MFLNLKWNTLKWTKMITWRRRSLPSTKKRQKEFLIGLISKRKNKKKKEYSSKMKSKLSKEKPSIIIKDSIEEKQRNLNEAHISTLIISSRCSMQVSQWLVSELWGKMSREWINAYKFHIFLWKILHFLIFYSFFIKIT